MDKWHDYFSKVAEETALLSHAVRLKVGAVAVKDRRIISCGFNGTAPGRPNECEYHSDGKLVTKDEVLHAEQNLIAHAAKNGVALNGADLYITHAPCELCAKLIMAAGFNTVYYLDEYRSLAGIEFLEQCGVSILKLND